MAACYLAGVGLVSSLGSNLHEALAALSAPPAPSLRAVLGAEQPIPYFAIAYCEPDWNKRCAALIGQTIAQLGVVDKRGGLYLASSSCNVGAIESGQAHATSISGFLAEIAQMIGWQGPVFWMSTACTSSLNALVAAQDAIEAGLFDEAVVLGLELENLLSLAGFTGMQLLSSSYPKPFQAERDGLVLGEAVAALRVNKTPSRWRIAAGVQVIDSTQASGASVEAYTVMLQKVLALADISANQIDIVKVQAAGSPANDAIEAAALNQFFQPVPTLITFKSLIGHTLGAAGAAELALLVALRENQQWPPANKNPCDPALGVTLASDAPATARYLLSCNLGFGGSHSCLVLEDCHAD